MCVFCSIIKGDIPTNLVYEDDVVMAILDISQATKGHTLIIPKNIMLISMMLKKKL